MRILELFAGVGGLHAALPQAEVVAAVDISRQAQAVYRDNFHAPYEIRAIESLSAQALGRYQADLWWLSPPCQPFSRRGKRRDAADPRSAALLNLLQQLPKVLPHAVALENVLGFEDSHCYERLQTTLAECGYSMQTRLLCPSELGWPNRRPRFYLLASRKLELRPWRSLPRCSVPWAVAAGIAAEEVGSQQALWQDPSLVLEEGLYSRVRDALDRVPLHDHAAVTACFTSSYGKALRHSGSYLVDGDRCRRFAPQEVAGLLGFPMDYVLSACDQRTAWKLLGNSLAIPAVRYVLSHVTGLAELGCWIDKSE